MNTSMLTIALVSASMVGQPLVAQPQVGQPQVEQPQVTQPQVAQPQTGQPQTGQLQSPMFLDNYSQAREQAISKQKPLAVVFGSGANGWRQVLARDTTPIPEVQQLLSDRYVCVYADTSTEAGRKLARDCGLRGNIGLVLSDRTGGLQAFSHDGVLPNPMLAMYLRKYADPQVVVRSTEVVPMMRTSFYPGNPASGDVLMQSGMIQQMQPVIGPNGEILSYQPINLGSPGMYNPYGMQPNMYQGESRGGRRGRIR